MSVLICDPLESQRLIEERRATGLDRFDEVWEGVYVMSPLANNEHQEIATRLSGLILAALPDAQVFAGYNVSDREEDWEHNYRIPDVAVFLPGNTAKNCNTHWCGGPDWAAEVVSKGDRSREKLAFYAALGTRELVVVDRFPWRVERYSLAGAELTLRESISLSQPGDLHCETLGISMRLSPGPSRPRLLLAGKDGNSLGIV